MQLQDSEIIRKDALKWVTSNKVRLIKVAHKIWEYAETSMEEVKSSKLLADELEKEGFSIELGVASIPTAFVATYGSGHPVIGFLGEYDALPNLSQRALPKKEPLEGGANGHGCGHNLLGTGAAGGIMAAKYAMQKDDLPGTVKYFGCPAEETLVGKVFMTKAGLFNDVDVALTWHPWFSNTVWMASTLAMNSVKFRFRGLTAHAAASPEVGRSALDAVELMDVGANYLREHIIPEARIHYVVTCGGEAPNIIPDFAEVWYFVRAPKQSDVEAIYDRVCEIANGAALMTGTKVDIVFVTATWEYLPSKVLSDLLYRNLKEVGPPRFSKEEKQFAREIAEKFPEEQKKRMSMAYNVPELEKAVKSNLIEYVSPPIDAGKTLPISTDIGEVSAKVPTAQCFTCSFVLGSTLHSWQAAAAAGMGIGHKGMVVASKALALTAIDLITKPQWLRKVRDEFENRTTIYKSSIPKGLEPPLSP